MEYRVDRYREREYSFGFRGECRSLSRGCWLVGLWVAESRVAERQQERRVLSGGARKIGGARAAAALEEEEEEDEEEAGRQGRH